MSNERFAGKVAIVTGGANGIGAATVRRLAAEGAAVVIADTDEGSGQSLADEIGSPSGFVRCDVTSEADWTHVVEAACTLGGIDVVVANAYLVQASAAGALSLESWRRQIDVCLTHVFLAVKATITPMRACGGSMVAVSSVHSRVGFAGTPAYDAAKGGICALVRQLAVEYGPEVRFNAVLPGAILTRTWDGISEEDRQPFRDRAPLRRLGDPNEVAAAIAFLASDDASFITGAELLVDGGWTISPHSAASRTD